MTDFVIHRSQLLPALNRAGRVVPTRNTVPVLANALFDVAGDGVTVTATDLEISVTATAEPVSVARPGRFTAPMKMVRDFVSKLPESAEIRIAVEDLRATLSAGRARLTLACIAAEDFPPVTAREYACEFEVPGRHLARLIDRTAFAVSTNEAHYYLHGVYLHCVDGVLCAVATDAARLAIAQGPQIDAAMAMPTGFGTNRDGDGMPGVILLSGVMDELVRMGEEAGDAPVRFSAGELAVRAEIDGWTVVSKIVNGNYPPYQKIVPANQPNVFVADAAEFAAALDRVLLAAAEKGEAVRLNFGADACRMSGRNLHANNETEDEVAGAFDGKDVAIGFNGRLLASILQKVAAKGEIRFELNTHATATIIRAEGDDAFTGILMPLTLPKWE